jgi:hypothetical protein
MDEKRGDGAKGEGETKQRAGLVTGIGIGIGIGARGRRGLRILRTVSAGRLAHGLRGGAVFRDIEKRKRRKVVGGQEDVANAEARGQRTGRRAFGEQSEAEEQRGNAGEYGVVAVQSSDHRVLLSHREYEAGLDDADKFPDIFQGGVVFGAAMRD